MGGDDNVYWVKQDMGNALIRGPLCAATRRIFLSLGWAGEIVLHAEYMDIRIRARRNSDNSDGRAV